MSVSEVVFVTAMNMKVANVVDAAIGRMLGKRVIYDFYISKYDSEVLDRKRIKRYGLHAKTAFAIDKLLYDLSTEVIFLYETDRIYYQKILNLNVKKNIHYATLCVDHRAQVKKNYSTCEKFVVCWWGTYIALHGLEKAIEAFSYLDDKFVFYVFGNSEEKSRKYNSLVDELGLSRRVIIHNDYSFSNGLLEDFLVDRCDLSLGVFGDSQKAKAVLTNKLLDSCSLGIPMITYPSSAAKEYFVDSEDILFCDNEAKKIAEKIFMIANDHELRAKVGVNCLQKFRSDFSPEALSSSLSKFI